MTRIAETELRDLLAATAGSDVRIELSKINPERNRVEVLCTAPGRLLGEARSTLTGLEEKSGWRFVVHQLTLPLEVLETELSTFRGFRRVKVLENGPKYLVEATFNEDIEPDHSELARIRFRTGWIIEKRLEGELSAEEAFRIIADEKPNAGVTGYRMDKPGHMSVWVADPGACIGENASEVKRLSRMTGWRRIQFWGVNEMPPDAKDFNTEYRSDRALRMELLKNRCRTCLGGGKIQKPVMTRSSIQWVQVMCPSCHGTGHAGV